jgi:methanogenic corrinoid protein MtbC1
MGSGGKGIIGTVKGDIHSLGKNIVANMLKSVRKEMSDEFGLDCKHPSIHVYLLSQLGACES